MRLQAAVTALLFNAVSQQPFCCCCCFPLTQHALSAHNGVLCQRLISSSAQTPWSCTTVYCFKCSCHQQHRPLTCPDTLNCSGAYFILLAIIIVRRDCCTCRTWWRWATQVACPPCWFQAPESPTSTVTLQTRTREPGPDRSRRSTSSWTSCSLT